MRRAVVLLLALGLGACAEMHVRAPDGSAGIDAGAPTDAGAVAADASATADAGPGREIVRCGRNECFLGEVCCSDVCGVCAPEGRCPTEGVCFEP